MSSLAPCFIKSIGDEVVNVSWEKRHQICSGESASSAPQCFCWRAKAVWPRWSMRAGSTACRISAQSVQAIELSNCVSDSVFRYYYAHQTTYTAYKTCD